LAKAAATRRGGEAASGATSALRLKQVFLCHRRKVLETAG
jgi:hypothetical protein